MLFTSPLADSRNMPLASKYTALFGWGLRLADVLVIVLAGVAAWWLRFGHLDVALSYERAIARGAMLGALLFSATPLYRSWRGRSLASELGNMAVVYTLLFAVLALYAVALKYSGEISRLWRGLWFLGSLAGGVGVRVLIRGVARWTRSRGMDLRYAVVVGHGRDAQRIIQALEQRSWAGIRVLGCFRAEPAHACDNDGVPCLGDLDTLAAFVEREHVHQVWIALPMRAQDRIDQVLEALRDSTADIKFVPDLFGLQLLNHSVEQVAGLPVINLQQTPLQGEGRVLKAIEDRLLALLILILVSPLMLLIAIAVKMSSPGPVFYKQVRVSWNNKKFEMLKFRSMPVNAEAQTGAIWAKPGETRATRIGHLLRRTSLDELPQFINVLKGDMSIVGPRPERPVFVEKFRHEIPAYMKKHMVKAGITGWAQVNGWRGSTDLARRIECDLYYIENWSLWFDLRIIAMTVATGMYNRNAY